MGKIKIHTNKYSHSHTQACASRDTGTHIHTQSHTNSHELTYITLMQIFSEIPSYQMLFFAIKPFEGHNCNGAQCTWTCVPSHVCPNKNSFYPQGKYTNRRRENFSYPVSVSVFVHVLCARVWEYSDGVCVCVRVGVYFSPFNGRNGSNMAFFLQQWLLYYFIPIGLRQNIAHRIRMNDK